MESTKKAKSGFTDGGAFSSVAVWQFMSFVMLLCFVWVSDILDLPAYVFDADPTPFSLYRVSLLSAAVITAGVITVGHTYEKQKALVNPLLMSCLYCHRVQTGKETWVHVEDYFIKHYPVEMDRGSCPECHAMLESVSALGGAEGKAAGS